MIALQKDELALLHVMCIDKLFARTCKLLRKDQNIFKSRKAPYLDMILNTYLAQVAKSRKQGQKQINKQRIAAQCLGKIQRAQLSSQLKQRAKNFIDHYVNQVQPLDYQQGKEYLKQIIQAFCSRQLSLALVNSPAIETLQRLVQQGKLFISTMSQSQQQKQSSINILSCLPQLLKRRVRIPFGVPYFDLATCGGVCTKEMAIIGAPTGGGKCQAYGTPLLMYDGSTTQIQDIKVGDLLMGPESNSVQVISTSKGRGPMYKIIPAAGDSFQVNHKHILTLAVHGIAAVVIQGRKYQNHQLLDIALDKYLALHSGIKKYLRLIRVPIQFQQEKDVAYTNAYFTGLGLGSGLPVKEQDIPYLGSLVYRRQFLAGIVDACGRVQEKGVRLCIAQQYVPQVIRVAQTSGFSIRTADIEYTQQYSATMLDKSYIQIYMVGEFATLPLMTAIKDKLVSTHRYLRFRVEQVPNADYYGFMLTGNGRYMHSDCIVTHNTMCATDLACAQARMNHLTMWFTYQQPFDGDIAQRIVANFTGMDLSSIRNLDYDAFSQQQKMLMNASVSGLADNLIGVDFSTNAAFDPADNQDIGGVYSIQKRIIQTQKKTGRKVKFVILDWFGQIISKLAAYSNVDLSVNYRHFARTFLAQLREMMQRRDVFILVFHQLSQKACDAKPTYIPNKTDFQDIRTVANNMQWCFLIGKRDQQTGVCWFNTDKARRCRPSLQMIQMDGEHARFRKVQDYIPTHKGGFISIKQQQQSKEIQQQLDSRTSDMLRAYSMQ